MSHFGLKRAALSATCLIAWAISASAQPTLSSPTNGATDQSASLTLSWGSFTDTSGLYTVQVTSDASFNTLEYGESGITGTSTPLSSLTSSPNTTSVPYYFWRVETGDPSANWSSVWSFTTLPAIPSLALPTNGAVNQSLTPTLSWNATAGASMYNVMVSTSPSFGTTVFSQTGITTGASATVSSGLVNSATYYWEVAATNAGGNTLGWSAANSFTTAAAVIPAPGVPILSSPSDNAMNQPVSGLTLSWTSSAGGPVASYAVQVGTTSSFSSTVLSISGLTATSEALPTLLNSTKYYWEVTATGNGTAMKLDSFVTAVAVIGAPGAPVLSSPSDNAQNQAIAGLTLSWTSGAGGPVTSYAVQVSTSSTFSSTVYKVSDLTTTSQTLPTLVGGTTYYWEITATGPGGTSSRSTADFMTVLGVPTPQSPANDAQNESVSGLVLSWSAVTGAATYNVQVSTSAGFGSPVFSMSGIASLSQAISGVLLANGTPYLWRVSARNGADTSVWSTPLIFTTAAVTGVPTLTSPTNNAQNLAISGLTLSWASNSGGPVTSYAFRLSTNADFSTTNLSGSDITTPSIGLSTLANGRTYYWEVWATGPGGTSNWSSAWSFTTIPLAPGAPLLTSPTDNAQDQPISGLTLSWAANSIGGEVTSFDVRVSTSAGFGTTDFSQSGTDLTAAVSGLKNDMLYYWKVSATNAAGTSWSSVWSFTTVLPPKPGVPSLSLPTNGATDLAIPVSLSWASTTGGSVASYAVQVSTSSGFGTTVFSRSGITSGSSQVVNDLTTGTLYYWEVSAINSSGTNGWAGPWNFTTIPTAPGVPTTLVSSWIATSATGMTVPVTLSWTAATGAATYNVQVSTDAGFGTTVFSQSGITGLSLVVNLANNMSYYWEVSATNAGGTSAWVSASFTITLTSVLKVAPEAARTDFVVKGEALVYSLNVAGPVGITFSDLLGRTALSVNRTLPAGHYTMALKDFSLAAGRYIVQFKAAGIQKRQIIFIQR